MDNTIPKYLLFFFAFISLFFIGIQSPSSLFLITFVVLWIIGNILCKDLNERKIFSIIFFINIIFFILYALIHLRITGTPFYGIDDENFYDTIIKVYRGENPVTYQYGGYKGFIWIGVFLYNVLSLLGIRDLSPYHLFLLNCFIGALSAVLLYKVIKYYYHGFEIKKAIFVFLCPLIIYYEVVLLRDIYVLFFFLLIVYIQKWRPLLRFIFSMAIIAFVYAIRDASGFFLLIFFFIYIAKKILSQKNFKILLTIAACILFLLLASSYFKNISTAESNYLSLSASEVSSNSVGIVLRERASANPLFRVLFILYTFLSPIPPPALLKFNFNNLFISIGAIYWYSIIPPFIMYAYKYFRKDVLLQVFTFTVLFSIIIVGFSSGDPRHLLFIKPLFIFYGILGIEKFPAKLKRTYWSIGIILFLVVPLYLLYKY